MTLVYGIASLEELPPIVEMKIAMFREAGHSNLLADGIEAIVLEDYKRLYGEDDAKHFVARTDERIVAMVGAFVKSDLPFRYFSPDRYGFIGDVYTEFEYRGKSVSTELNKSALEWLKANGIAMVRLLASDAGRPIYERLGFASSDEMVLILG